MSSPLWGGDFLCRFGSCAHTCPHALCTLALTHTQYLDAHIAPTQFMCAPIMRPLAITYAHNSHMDAHARPQHVHARPHSPTHAHDIRMGLHHTSTQHDTPAHIHAQHMQRVHPPARHGLARNGSGHMWKPN